jgi:hypothetical protein
MKRNDERQTLAPLKPSQKNWWEPPHRFVMAWQIHGDWTYQPDLTQSTEVEVRFTAEPDASRVRSRGRLPLCAEH